MLRKLFYVHKANKEVFKHLLFCFLFFLMELVALCLQESIRNRSPRQIIPFLFLFFLVVVQKLGRHLGEI